MKGTNFTPVLTSLSVLSRRGQISWFCVYEKILIWVFFRLTRCFSSPRKPPLGCAELRQISNFSLLIETVGRPLLNNPRAIWLSPRLSRKLAKSVWDFLGYDLCSGHSLTTLADWILYSMPSFFFYIITFINLSFQPFSRFLFQRDLRIIWVHVAHVTFHYIQLLDSFTTIYSLYFDATWTFLNLHSHQIDIKEGWYKLYIYIYDTILTYYDDISYTFKWYYEGFHFLCINYITLPNQCFLRFHIQIINCCICNHVIFCIL
jgi:hypothetical protein